MVCPRGLCLVPCCLNCMSVIQLTVLRVQCKMFNLLMIQKYSGIIQNPCDTDILQQDLNYISNWSKLQLFNFNITKCSVMHMGRNDKATYKLFNLATNSNILLQPTMEQRPRSVITPAMNLTVHCHKIAIKQIKLRVWLSIISSTSPHGPLWYYTKHLFGHTWSTAPQYGIPTIVKISTHLKKFREEPRSLFYVSLHSVMNPD